MEIYVNYLAIEVTRRCNMKCNHCLRGDAQNLDISTAVLSGIAKHIHPASVIFTGGEPSLNVPAIKRYFELAERYDTMPAAFYVATNGATSKEQMRDLALTLLESYAKMEEQDMCEVDVSVDMFHEAFRDNDNAKILSGLSFFGQGKQHSVKDDDLAVKYRTCQQERHRRKSTGGAQDRHGRAGNGLLHRVQQHCLRYALHCRKR